MTSHREGLGFCRLSTMILVVFFGHFACAYDFLLLSFDSHTLSESVVQGNSLRSIQPTAVARLAVAVAIAVV